MLLSTQITFESVSFCGFQNEREGKLSDRKAFLASFEGMLLSTQITFESVSFCGFQNELEGKLSDRKAFLASFEGMLLSTQITFESVSFCGFQNELEGKLAVRQTIPPRSFVLILFEQAACFFLRLSKRARREACR
ncbi:hypothetical protein [Robiginitalea sp. IMCC43444]|uniref:hypothetical protein n=1 Tax=Robiginitalea sp. IMCC43444 TaxID=3459121 RepID=UPI0040438A99